MIPAPQLVSLKTIEQPLYSQLLVLALVAFAIGQLAGGWRWGLSATSGVLAAILYYMMLAVQVRRQFARGRLPNVMILVGALAARQIICLTAPAACFFALGTSWLACLLSLVVARHWILFVAMRRNRAPMLAAS